MKVIIGTLGVLLVAKRKGLLAALAPESEKLRMPGSAMRARLGPMRSCIIALHLRSASVSRVARIITNMSIRKIMLVRRERLPAPKMSAAQVHF